MQTCQFCESTVGGGVSGPALSSWSLCVIAALRTLPSPACSPRYRGLHEYLARAERDGELSEFYALMIQAILAMSDESEFAIDYLEMAEAVAETAHEHAIVAETRLAHDWLQVHRAASAKYIHATLVHDCKAMELWNNLLVALCRLGEGGDTQRRELLDPRAA